MYLDDPDSKRPTLNYFEQAFPKNEKPVATPRLWAMQLGRNLGM